MTDEELAKYLGIHNNPRWPQVVAKISPKRRKLFEYIVGSDVMCKYCGGITDMSYGLAGGGVGTYSYCLECDRVNEKWEDSDIDES